MARPPKISDADLRRVIGEFRQRSTPLTGTAVRTELQRRFGIRAGTQRVYGFLREHLSPAPWPTTTTDAAVKIAALETALAAAVQRAELAEFREQAHQDKWANEIYELRAEVQRLSKQRGR